MTAGKKTKYADSSGFWGCCWLLEVLCTSTTVNSGEDRTFPGYQSHIYLIFLVKDKKAAQEKEREARVAEDAANLEFSSRRIEERKIEALLIERGLRIKEVGKENRA